MNKDHNKFDYAVALMKSFAIEYDKIHGVYPEHIYEGKAFYEFVCDRLEIKYEDLKSEYPEIYGEYK